MIGFGNPLFEGPNSHYASLAQLAREKQSCEAPLAQRVAQVTEPQGGLAQVETRGGLADTSSLRKNVPLPETADELCAVANNVHADPGEIRLGVSESGPRFGCCAVAMSRTAHIQPHPEDSRRDRPGRAARRDRHRRARPGSRKPRASHRQWRRQVNRSDDSRRTLIGRITVRNF